jgi:hypothetical protein
VERKSLTKNYRHSLIYAVNVGTPKKTCGSKNRLNQGYVVVLKGGKWDKIKNRGK